MYVNRPTVNLIADAVGATLPPENEWRPDLFDKIFDAVPDDKEKQARERFDQDPRDTSQPVAMAVLLEKIYHKQLHKPATADLLLDILYRCRTGDARIKGIFRWGRRWRTRPGVSVERSTMSALSIYLTMRGMWCWRCL